MERSHVGGVTQTALVLALRAYVVPTQRRPKRGPRRPPPTPRWPVDVLVLDVETTTDEQRLIFGFYRHCQWRPDGMLVCLQEGIIHADDLPGRDPDAFAQLEAYAQTHPAEVVPGEDAVLRLLSRSQFIGSETSGGPFWNLAYRAQALVVGYNLAFDLSRLAIGWSRARRGPGRHADIFANGFSLTLWGNQNPAAESRPDSRFHPRLRLKHLDSKRTLFRFSGRLLRAQGQRRERGLPGRFLDLRTMVFALTDRALTLEGACEAFNAKERKYVAREHGRVTAQYIEYGRQDVRATASLLEEVRREFDRHPLDLAPDQVRSPASMAKAYLRALGVRSPTIQFADVSLAHIGQATTAYYGGRAETRIRSALVPVTYLDFVSMYPTVNALLGLWGLLTAERLEIVDATPEVKQLLATINVDRCFDPIFWRELCGFVCLEPDGDILPVRAAYDEHAPSSIPGADAAFGSFTIGVNPLVADDSLWYALPDVVTATLLGKRPPKVRKAWRVVAVGRQEALRPVDIRGEIRIDPAREDLFRRLVEARQGTKQRQDLSQEEQERLDRSLKVTGNSGSYGIYAEMNRVDLPPGEHELVTVYGRGKPLTCPTHAPEELGEFCFPIFAALTTSAARLMLALLERCVHDLGGVYAFCDTDSMAVVATATGGLVPCPGGAERTGDGRPAIRALSKQQVEEALVRRFEQLNPYDRQRVPGSILKVEDVNFVDGRWTQLYAFPISAKRYVLLNLGPRDEPILRKPSEHGLGHLLDPTRKPGDPQDYEQGVTRKEQWPRWIGDVWRWILAEARGQPLPPPDWFARPAVSQLTVSSPRLLGTFAQCNAGRTYDEGVKPMSFGLTVYLDRHQLPIGVKRTQFQLVAPYETDASRWLAMSWIEKYTTVAYRITTNPLADPDAIVVRTIGGEVDRYRAHPESKSADADGNACGPSTTGLLQRRPVLVERLVYVGKESTRMEEVDQGLITDWDDIRTVYVDPRDDIWKKYVEPLVRVLPRAQLAREARVSVRTVQAVRRGRPPSATTARALTAAVLAAARCLVSGRSTPPEVRRLAERFLRLRCADRIPKRRRHTR